MLKKLFSVKKDGFHKVYNFLGIKFKFPNNFLIKQKITHLFDNEWRIRHLTRNYQFFWANIERYTVKQRIWYLSELFYRLCGYYPNFKKPRSLNEKLNWMKFNYIDPSLSRIVDKYEFKEYIKEQLGEGFTVPLLGVYDDVNDIDFDALPEKFVVKTTIGNGGIGVQLVTDKKKLKIDKLKYNFNNLMQEWNSPYYQSYQPGFKNVVPRIIIEEYMPIREGNAFEYKMFCFHGEMKFCLVECDYFGKKPARAIYTKDFEPLPFTIRNMPKRELDEKPALYEKMIEMAEQLSAKFPFVRVDFYVIGDKIYLSELTFNSGAGFSVFTPVVWDFNLGEYLDLEKLNPAYVKVLDEFKNTPLSEFYAGKQENSL